MRDSRKAPVKACVFFDLYGVIDRYLQMTTATTDFAADLISVMPPRGHALHALLGVCSGDGRCCRCRET